MDVRFKHRHTLRDSDIKNYRFDRNLQVWSAVFRVETFHKFLLEDIMRAFYPTRGNPCVYEVATRTTNNQLKTRMRM